MNHRSVTFALLALIATLLPCCTAGQATFEGHDEQQVWLAMKAAAHLPAYLDLEPNLQWQVDANEVWSSDDERRIEIHRELSRLEGVRIDRRTRRKREFDFEILMVAHDPPAATFTARGRHLPAQAAAEAERFFADVRELLASAGDAERESQPVVDIDEFDPDG